MTTRLLDVNVLLALTNPSHVHNKRSQQWFKGVDSWATTPITQTGFIRLMLNPAVAGQAIPAPAVLLVLQQLLKLDGHVFWDDPSSLAAPRIDTTGLVGHRQVTDFHLVNLAAINNGVLATFDRALPKALTPPDRQHVELI